LPDIICNTSPIQYLHQLDLLSLLPTLFGRVQTPPAVVDELTQGHTLGMNLPDVRTLDWLSIQRPTSISALPLVNDLGRGETEVLMLALESQDAVVILDDAMARRMAHTLGIRFTGTLGLLLDAKKAGHLPMLTNSINKLDELGFRLDTSTRSMILRLANE